MSWDSLLSGAVGGALILLGQILYSRWQAKQKRATELEGLLTLLYLEEIAPNTAHAQLLAEDPSKIVVVDKTALTRSITKTALWETSRNRVSELTDDGALIVSLATFYSCVNSLDFSLELEQQPEAKKQSVLRNAAGVQEAGEDLANRVKEIIVRPN